MPYLSLQFVDYVIFFCSLINLSCVNYCFGASAKIGKGLGLSSDSTFLFITRFPAHWTQRTLEKQIEACKRDIYNYKPKSKRCYLVPY